LKNKKQILIKN